MNDQEKINALMIYYQHWGKEEIEKRKVIQGINHTITLLCQNGSITDLKEDLKTELEYRQIVFESRRKRSTTSNLNLLLFKFLFKDSDYNIHGMRYYGSILLKNMGDMIWPSSYGKIRLHKVGDLIIFTRRVATKRNLLSCLPSTLQKKTTISDLCDKEISLINAIVALY